MAWIRNLVHSPRRLEQRATLDARSRQVEELRGAYATAMRDNRASRFELRETLAQGVLDIMQSDRGRK